MNYVILLVTVVATGVVQYYTGNVYYSVGVFLLGCAVLIIKAFSRN